MDESIRGITPFAPQPTVTGVAGSLHDFDNSDLGDIALDMEKVTAAALAPKGGPVWKLEIECHGKPFKWTGTAATVGVATLKAMADLSDDQPDFNRYKARVVACVEVAA